MKSRTLFISLVLLALFASIMLVSAERYVGYQWREGTIRTDGGFSTTTQPVNGVSIYGYKCADAECTASAGTLWNGEAVTTGSGNSIILTYPTPEPRFEYALFFVKDGFVPYELTANYWGTRPGESPQHALDNWLLYLSKKESCRADLGSISTHVAEGTLTFDVSVAAPFSHPSPAFDTIKFTPDSVAAHYDSKVQLNVEVRKNGIVFADTKQLTLEASAQDVQTFSLPVTPGTYTIRIVSSVPDTKCRESESSTAQTTVEVTSTPVNNETTPLISIVSPRPITYATNMILVELATINATDVWYEWNGTQVPYMGAQTVSFPTGVQVLTAYARNSAGVAVASVNFNVQPDLSDITPPGPVTNLHLQAKGTNFIAWSWTNPTDSDFFQSIIFIDGENVANTSSTTYSISGLAPESTHTISIMTKDVRNNVNTAAMSDTQTTLALNDTNNDTTPPGPISDLTITNRGEHFMSWSWTNPTDSDFAAVILTLNGENVGRVSTSGFSKASLNDDTLYTLCGTTVDFAGNVNAAAVCISGQTDKDSNNNDDDDNDDDDRTTRKKTTFPDTTPIEELPPFVVEDEESMQVLTGKTQRGMSAILIVALLLGVFALLLVILLVLMRRAFEQAA